MCVFHIVLMFVDYKQNPTVGRSFPRELDDALRKVDAIVVGEHAQSWRINPYFAKLMQVLPYTKNCLKGSMVRLEARDAAMEARRAMDQAFTSVITSVKSNQTATPMTKATAGILYLFRVYKRIRLDKIQSSHPFARSLYLYFQAEDKYIIAENAYRKLMQAVDKKTASQADFLPLQPKTERTASYNKVHPRTVILIFINDVDTDSISNWVFGSVQTTSRKQSR